MAVAGAVDASFHLLGPQMIAFTMLDSKAGPTMCQTEVVASNGGIAHFYAPAYAHCCSSTSLDWKRERGRSKRSSMEEMLQSVTLVSSKLFLLLQSKEWEWNRLTGVQCLTYHLRYQEILGQHRLTNSGKLWQENKRRAIYLLIYNYSPHVLQGADLRST